VCLRQACVAEPFASGTVPASGNVQPEQDCESGGGAAPGAIGSPLLAPPLYRRSVSKVVGGGVRCGPVSGLEPPLAAPLAVRRARRDDLLVVLILNSPGGNELPDHSSRHSLCGRILKMALRHRNNSLFSKTEKDAEVGDLYVKLINATTLNGENPFEFCFIGIRLVHS
jgi:hypothetical protein